MIAFGSDAVSLQEDLEPLEDLSGRRAARLEPAPHRGRVVVGMHGVAGLEPGPVVGR
jgi:hypothetical protein